MSAALSVVEFACTITWPVRPAIQPFSCGLQHKHTASASLSFPATYLVAPGVQLVGISWTAVELRWMQPFVGGAAAADAWLQTENGESKTLGQAEELSSLLVDSLRASHPADRNLAVLRSFGIRDWPYYEFGVAGLHKNVRVGVHAEGQFRSFPTNAFGGARVSLVRNTSFPSRAMLRASDLAEGGYPTEAVLIAFGALDAAVQDFLIGALKKKGVAQDAAVAMLRNITTKRLATYLDGVLALACGRSIAEQGDLFAKLLTANRARNDAIHNGAELTRAQAVGILDSIGDVFLFLRTVDSDFEPGFRKSTFFC